MHHQLREVMPSVAASLGVEEFEDSLGLGSCTSTVVLLVDGLGLTALQSALARGCELPVLTPALAASQVIDAPFPTTTPNGLAALGTGLTTGCHGVVGASFVLPETGKVLWPLAWADDPHPTAVQPEPTVLERAASAGVKVASIAPRAFGSSGLTRAALRGGEYVGSDSFGERVAAVRRTLSDAGPALVYVYWGDLDKTGHVHGVDSEDWRQELAAVELLIDRLIGSLPSGSRLVVTADHGMVDTGPLDRLEIEDASALRAGVHVIAGEPRMRHVYARPGAADDVLAAWRATLGDRAVVHSRQEAIGAGLFGEIDQGLEDRIGDVIALATGTTVLASREVDSKLSALRGQHGSDTEAETSIPLLVWST